jgi:hypothetical protein
MLQMNCTDDLLGLRQELAAGRRQVHARRGPFEQADAELLLQRLDAPRSRAGLCNASAARRWANRATGKGAELIEVHDVPPCAAKAEGKGDCCVAP